MPGAGRQGNLMVTNATLTTALAKTFKTKCCVCDIQVLIVDIICMWWVAAAPRRL